MNGTIFPASMLELGAMHWSHRKQGFVMVPHGGELKVDQTSCLFQSPIRGDLFETLREYCSQ